MNDNFVPSPIESLTVSEKVYQWIKTAIISGDFKPGERIVQEELTKLLQVSRTPVRDALQRLNSEGLIVITPFHGAEVFALSKKNLAEIYEVRILLESYAAQKACECVTPEEIDELERLNTLMQEHKTSQQKCMLLDRDFHCLICRAARIDYIVEILTAAWDKSDPYKSIYFTQSGNIERAVLEHKEMIRSLRNKEKGSIAQAIRHHLLDVVDMISYQYETFQ